MADEDSKGYTEEEYYTISLKHGLPKRCPILRKCCRATLTRYEIGHRLGGSYLTFDQFLHFQGQEWEPEKMIKEIEVIDWESNDIVCSVENVCPEISLFEPKYFPFNFRQSAYGDASYYKESRRFEAKAKHYSDCAEFSEYLFLSSGNKMKAVRTTTADQIPEKTLEDYLANNIEALEPGLRFIERQKTIGKWSADIFASDAQGNDILIELKSKKLNRDEIHKLIGQVSKYFNSLKKASLNLKLFIVLPRTTKDKLEELSRGLQHWIENNRVGIYQFDYLFYEETFVFTKIQF